jgi:hypothetical protein
MTRLRHRVMVIFADELAASTVPLPVFYPATKVTLCSPALLVR